MGFQPAFGWADGKGRPEAHPTIALRSEFDCDRQPRVVWAFSLPLGGGTEKEAGRRPTLHPVERDASRVSYVEILADERSEAACAFLVRAVAWFAERGVRVERVMTDNGSAFVSKAFTELCASLGLRHKRIRPYTPRTNGKAERFIQTLLREWAYRFSYTSSEERKRWLAPYVHFYNCHRAHSALAYNPPISRLDRNNVLRHNS